MRIIFANGWIAVRNSSIYKRYHFSKSPGKYSGAFLYERREISLTFIFYRCRIKTTSTKVENKTGGVKIEKNISEIAGIRA